MNVCAEFSRGNIGPQPFIGEDVRSVRSVIRQRIADHKDVLTHMPTLGHARPNARRLDSRPLY